MALLGPRLIGEMQFPGCPEILSDVRIYVTRWLVKELTEAAEDGELLDNLRLLATELAANAIKHSISGRWSKGSFRVRMWLGAEQVRVEVMDQGWWSGPRLRNNPDETSGRGLHILTAVATQWGVERRWLGRTVWFELPIQFPTDAHPADLGPPCRRGTMPPPGRRYLHDLAMTRVDIAFRNLVEISKRRSA
ncbi:ATP-binding protein [Nonomuraea glycinis]|uniref:ATP-binding protein n=1 Tax=Nonomuraea glycinis TaxID=2047744 RepID=UPI0033AA7270